MTTPQFADRPGLAPYAADYAPERAGVSVLITAQPARELLDRWDCLVESCSGSDVVQLSAWARLRGRYGFDTVYVLVHDGEELLGGAQILHRRIRLLGRIGYVQTAPVIGAVGSRYAAVRAALAAELATLGQRRFRFLFIQPPEGADDVSAGLIEHGFRRGVKPIVGPGSVRVDLSESQEQLRRNLSATVRRWTNKWHAAGVSARVGDRSDLSVLVELLTHTAQYRGYDAYTSAYVRALYDQLAAAHRAQIFVGEVHGQPVAATLVTACGGTLSLRLKGMDRSSSAAKLHVPAAVDWEIIRWAKTRGYDYYDLGGLNELPLRGLVDGEPYDRSTWNGEDRYKIQFGGIAYRNPPTVEMIRPWAIRWCYDLAWRSSAGRALVERAGRSLRRNRR